MHKGVQLVLKAGKLTGSAVLLFAVAVGAVLLGQRISLHGELFEWARSGIPAAKEKPGFFDCCFPSFAVPARGPRSWGNPV